MTKPTRTKVLERQASNGKRRCLMCGAYFTSEGNHNRICKKCKSSQAWRDGQHTHEFEL